MIDTKEQLAGSWVAGYLGGIVVGHKIIYLFPLALAAGNVCPQSVVQLPS